jgi:hypothetical protein
VNPARSRGLIHLAAPLAGRVTVAVVLALIFVYTGFAARLWDRVERDVDWRTGPTWSGVLAFFAIYWAAWAAITRNVFDAARFLIASCVIVALQVLMPATWLIAALGVLLASTLIDAYLLREPFRRAVTAWAWRGASVALATLLIHPYFVEVPPLFVVRLVLVTTCFDWLGERVGVSRRLTRFVPSLYVSSSSSPWMAAHERVAR